MKTLLLILLLVPMMSFGQNVYIPDANFKFVLVVNTAINTNGDSEIQVSEASAFTGTINCYGLSISDLTGIEAFTALGYLACGFNQLTSLDVSSCTALTTLYCHSNQLTSLDVSSNTALAWLQCQDNQLTSLDVSNNTALTYLHCSNNEIISLDVTQNTALTYFFAVNTQLECLNVQNGNNTALGDFYATDNPNLTCIEVDDVNYSTANWTFIDSQTSFSTDCGNDCSACTPTASIDSHTSCGSYTAPDGQVYTSTGIYTAIIDNAAGCDSVITIDLTINPTPSAAVTQNGATLTATQTGAAYQWLDCDNGNAPIVGEVNQSFTPISTGNYAVIVTVNGCSNTSECRLVDYTGIGELNNTPKQLIKIVDVLGRETPFKPNTPLLYIYNDGTVERKVVLK